MRSTGLEDQCICNIWCVNCALRIVSVSMVTYRDLYSFFNSNRAVMKPYVAADHVSSYRSIWFLSSDWIGYHCLCRTAPRRDLFLATLIGHETVFFCTDPCCVRPYGHVFSESRCSCFWWSIVAHSSVFVGPEYFLLFDLLTRFCGKREKFVTVKPFEFKLIRPPKNVQSCWEFREVFFN